MYSRAVAATLIDEHMAARISALRAFFLFIMNFSELVG